MKSTSAHRNGQGHSLKRARSHDEAVSPGPVSEEAGLKTLLESSGIKLTRQRLDLLAQLGKAHGPITAEQLFLNLRESASAISLSTVYRILDAFELKGLVEKAVSPEANKAVYELSRHEHGHHLVCTQCKVRMTITGCPLAGYEEALSSSTHFKITGHRLEVYGLCPKCQAELGLL